jgi:hypothetical protein
MIRNFFVITCDGGQTYKNTITQKLMMSQSTTASFEVRWKDMAGRLTVREKQIEWEESNVSGTQATFFRPKKFVIPYPALKDLKVHKSVPKLRIELALPIDIPQTSVVTTNKQPQQDTAQNIDFDFTTVEFRNQSKELITQNKHKSVQLAKIPPDERKKLNLLSKDPKLKQVYDELVGKGIISKQEFWNERKHLLSSESKASSKQITGPKNSLDTILDPNQKRWTINAQVIRQIFIEYPGVEKAWNEKVPKEMSEEKFWELFKQSYYFHKGRPSTMNDRSIAQQRDTMFKEFEKYDDQAAENDVRASAVEKFVDITRNESWGEGYGLKPDELTAPTKLAMDNKLMKHFNLTSARVMNSYLGHKEIKKAQNESIQPNISDAMDTSDGSRKHTIMDDLISEDTSQQFIPLKIQDKHRYFEGLVSDKALPAHAYIVTATPFEMIDAFRDEVDVLIAHSSDLSTGLIPSELSSNIALEIINQASQNDITLAEFQEQSLPQDFQKQFKLNFTVCSEILRHLWSLMALPKHIWKPDHTKKADRLLGMLKEQRIALANMQSNHQTKQLTNAVIESIESATAFYTQKYIQPSGPTAQSNTVAGNNVRQQAATSQVPRFQGSMQLTPPANKPATSGISFSLGNALSKKTSTPPPVHKNQMMTDDDEEDDEEDNVFSERPTKKIKKS